MKRYITFLFLATCTLISACSDDDDVTNPTTKDLTLSIGGLENLSADYVYEGWIIVSGSPVSTGTFTVNDAGILSRSSFTIDEAQLALATTFILTIEPASDTDPAPSAVHILAGDFAGSNGTLSIGHAAALGNDFGAAMGSYILATPTNGADTDERSGVWWLDPTNGPPFPGEDYLINAPMGVTFPTDLAGATVVISIEPEPDNSPAPFLLKPLVGNVPTTAIDHTSYDMSYNASASNPTGVVTR
jgi:hypothetical protein